MSLPIRKIENLRLQRLYTVDEGTEIELIEANIDGEIKFDAEVYPILSIYAAEQEKLYMALSIDGVSVAIPIIEIEKMIECAKNFVHSESWFEAGNQWTDEPNLSID
jgi:hypothetical protein